MSENFVRLGASYDRAAASRNDAGDNSRVATSSAWISSS